MVYSKIVNNILMKCFFVPEVFLSFLLLLSPLDVSARKLTKMKRLRSVDISLAGVDSMSTEDALRLYSDNIVKFNSVFPQEKVYLQFDNTSYYIGETIWFKAFVVSASTHGHAPSSVLYVDLISPTGEFLKQEKLRIGDGQADGSLPLIDGSTAYARELRQTVLPYPSGFYEVRAYTANMQNFGDDVVFRRVLPVFEKPAKDGDYYGEAPLIKNHYNQEVRTSAVRPDTKKSRDALSASFYPEGGNLVRGLTSRVAFKLIDADGLGVDASGTLDDTVSLVTLHDGMGVFEYTPTGDNGRATFTLDGRTYNFRLPSAERRGYAFRADTRASGIAVDISGTQDAPADTLGITVTCRGSLEYFGTVALHGGRAETVIPYGDMPEGVCQLTLFDRKGNIFARRSVYHRTGTPAPQITVSSGATELAPFSRVRLGIDVSDETGRGVRDRICLSVRDSRCPGTAVHDDVRTSLLLSSDIKGYVQNPEYYFERDDAEHLAALDLLMMVQGWERYDWQTMTGARPFQGIHRIEQRLTLNGWIESPFIRKGMDSVRITATVTSLDKTRTERFRSVTGPDGYFGFDLEDYDDLARLSITARPRLSRLAGTSARIHFERSILPEIRAYQPFELVLTDAYGHNATSKTRKAVTLRTEEAAAPAEDNFPKVIDVDDGVTLPDVDISDRRVFIDYGTFQAYDARRDTEMELDKGDFSSDIAGYLISKGYTIVFDKIGSIFKINGHTPLLYIHDSDGWRRGSTKTDMANVRSITVFDRVMSKKEAFDLLSERYNFEYVIPENHFIDFRPSEMMADMERTRGIFIDIELKDASQRKSRDELMRINSRETYVNGFSPRYEFYSPEYPDGAVRGDVDYRRTLYWNPNVVTDAAGHAEVEFYNNSYSRHLSISGAGITAGGTPYVLDAEF